MRKQSPEVLRYASKEECIILLLASGQKTVVGNDIQENYIRWQKLSPSQRNEMCEGMLESLNKEGKFLYRTLMEGFEIWDDTQNEDGAPGWCVTQSSLGNVVNHMESNLQKLLHCVDRIWTQKYKHITERKENANISEKIRKGKPTDSNSQGKEGNHCLTENVTGTMQSITLENPSQLEQSLLPSIKFSLLLSSEMLKEDTEKNSIEHFSNSQFSYANETLPHSNQEGVNSGEYGRNPFYDDVEDSPFEEDILLKNLQIDECQADSDFEKQISPLLSEEEFLN